MRAAIRRALALAPLALALGGCGVAGDSAVDKAEQGGLPPAEDALEPGLQGQVPLSDQLARAPGVTGAVGLDSYRRGTRLVPGAPVGIFDPASQRDRGGNYEMAWLDDCAYIGFGDPLRQVGTEQGVGDSAVPLPGGAPTGAGGGNAADDEPPGGGPQPQGGGGCEALPVPVPGGIGLSDPCHPPDPPADAPSAGLAIVSARNPLEPEWIYTMQLRITPRSPTVGGPAPQPPSELRTSTATANPWEALQTNDARNLIVAGTANELVIYQAVYNCKYPSRRSIVDTGDLMVHGLRIAADGMTAYAAEQNTAAAPGATVLAAIDLTDLRATSQIATFADAALGVAGVHGIDLNADGTRAYVAYGAAPYTPAGVLAAPPAGVLVLDVADVQARKPDGRIRALGRLEWDGAPHAVRWARIGGRPYLLVADSQSLPGACPWGIGRILDLADETAPVEVAQVALEVNDPANCAAVAPDGAVYSAQAVSVDDATNARHAFFSWNASGLRVFDVSEPAHPVEVAYYNPAPNPDTLYRSFATTGGLTLDATLSQVRYRPETGHVWFTSVASGFHILEFTRSMGPAP